MYHVIEVINGELNDIIASFETKELADLEIEFLTKNNPGKEYALFDDKGLAW